jgi:hypothetical protein
MEKKEENEVRAAQKMKQHLFLEVKIKYGTTYFNALGLLES